MTKHHLPSSLDGSLTPFMSRRRLQQQADDVDAMLGGTERLYHEANRSPESYWKFKDMHVRLQPKEATLEHSMSAGVEELLKRVEERKKARAIQIIDVTATEVKEMDHAAQGQPDERS